MSTRTQWIGLAVFVLLCLGAGALGAVATTPEIGTWYRTLVKPAWNPPDWIFGPVWTTLFVLMGIAAWLVWRRDRESRAVPMALFGIQLVLNVGWSWVFFGMHEPGWACVEIAVLWIAIVATMWSFFRTVNAAGWLLLPYLAWVSYAAFLNFTIWRLNS